MGGGGQQKYTRKSRVSWQGETKEKKKKKKGKYHTKQRKKNDAPNLSA